MENRQKQGTAGSPKRKDTILNYLNKRYVRLAHHSLAHTGLQGTE